MATRFYLPATAAVTAISPDPDAGWEDITFMARAILRAAKIGDTLATVAVDDASNANRDVLFRQYVSFPLSVGQTITGGQALEAQCRVLEVTTGNNMFFALGIRVLNGTTVQKTVLDVTRDATEASATDLTNRRLTATSAATNYTTVFGDRLVIEIGMGGDPTGANHHDSSMRLGDSAVGDLAEDDTSTADNNPWVELTDTLTFDAEPLSLPTIASTLVLTAATLAYAMTLPVIASGAALTPPTVSITQALSLPAIASGAALNSPALAYAISLPAIASGANLDAPTVSGGEQPAQAGYRSFLAIWMGGAGLPAGAGDQGLTLPHIASGAALNSPALAYAVTLPHVGPDSVLNAPSLAYAVTLPTIGSGASLFAPTLAYAVSLPAIASTAQLFAPTLAYQVQLPAIGSGAALNAPTLAYAVTLPAIGPDTQLFPPTVVESGSLALPHIDSTAVLNVPALAYSMSLPFIGSTAQLSAPSLAAEQTLSLPALASGALLNAPTLAYAISLPTITGTVVNAPSVAYAVTLPFIGSTAALFPPSLLYDQLVSLPTIPSGSQLFPPVLFTGTIFTPDIELTLNLQRGTALGLALNRTSRLSAEAAQRIGLTLETSPD